MNTSSPGQAFCRSASYWPRLIAAKWGASGSPINRRTPASRAAPAPSAMKGGACFMPTKVGSSVRSARAAAWARVIRSSGEPPIAS